MPKRGGNISLSSYDDIFETDESRAEAQLERVRQISISELVPFKDHPFRVVDDEAMLRTTESIAQYGVLTPLIARPLENGKYEIISGHRRAHAAEAADDASPSRKISWKRPTFTRWMLSRGPTALARL